MKNVILCGLFTNEIPEVIFEEKDILFIEMSFYKVVVISIEEDIPYITHPLAVGIILAKAGCSDEVIIAGILHDTVEDTSIKLDDIGRMFGQKVAEIVKGSSEPDKSLPWEKRKQHTIEHLKTAPREVRLVVCADKLHNIRTIASAVKHIGNKVWERFNRGKDAQKWYYQGLVQSLRDDSADEAYQILHSQFAQEVGEVFGSEM